VTLLPAVALLLTACSPGSQPRSDEGAGTAGTGSDSSDMLQGTLAGAGSSAQSAAVQAWISGFQDRNAGVEVNYEPIGSDAGRELFLAGGLDFAGSDAALDSEELAAAEQRCGDGSLIEVPLYLSPIAVAFNLPGIDSLNLRPETIAGSSWAGSSGGTPRRSFETTPEPSCRI
jgi:phosphate transport system substrate-binding protein